MLRAVLIFNGLFARAGRAFFLGPIIILTTFFLNGVVFLDLMQNAECIILREEE